MTWGLQLSSAPLFHVILIRPAQEIPRFLSNMSQYVRPMSALAANM